jgi:hypothetical protein
VLQAPSKVGNACLATVLQDPVQVQLTCSCPEPESYVPPHFTTCVDPKGGVHVHWLLAHCAVFKERVLLARVPPRHLPGSAFGRLARRARGGSDVGWWAVRPGTPLGTVRAPTADCQTLPAGLRNVNLTCHGLPFHRRRPRNCTGPPPTGATTRAVLAGSTGALRRTPDNTSPRTRWQCPGGSAQPGEAALADLQDAAAELARRQLGGRI